MVAPFLIQQDQPARAPDIFRRLLRVVSPTCEDMTELVSAMMDRELPLRTRLCMRLHFFYCRYCRRMREQLALLRRAAAALDDSGEAEPSDRLGAAAKEQLRSILKRSL